MSHEIAPLKHPSSLSRPELLDAFLESLSPATLAAYSADLADFARAIVAPSTAAAVEQLLELDAGHANALVLAYRQRMLSLGLATATVCRRLGALRALTRLARTLGRITWTVEVRNPKLEARRDVRGPDPKSRRKVWRQLSTGDSPEKRRNRAIVALLFDLALRRKEVCGLDRADVDLARGEIQIRAKGHREQTRMTLPATTSATLAGWIEVRGDEPGPLFYRLDRGAMGSKARLTGDGLAWICRSLGVRAKLDLPLRPHGFRHAAITAALDAGNDIRDVRKFSRHAKLETVLKYDDARDDVAGKIASGVSRERNK
jgi:integrase/recombinase XerC